VRKGYFGVGIYHNKFADNLGCLWRSAYAMRASFIFTIGKRYKHQRCDTARVERHTPLFHYEDYEGFINNVPTGCEVICVERCRDSHSLKDFTHPDRAIYLLGAEDYGLPEEVLQGRRTVSVPSKICLNLAVTGSIVMYDRKVKST